MNWYTKFSESDSTEKKIKNRLRSSPFFTALFKKHDLDIDILNNLKIKVEPLDDVYCKASESEIIIDKDLVDSDEVFGPKFHYIAHEILHFLKRAVEEKDYFADPEERESFAVAMAYQMHEWQNKENLCDLIKKEFLPLIKMQISDDEKADSFFQDRFAEAKMLLKEMGLCSSLS